MKLYTFKKPKYIVIDNVTQFVAIVLGWGNDIVITINNAHHHNIDRSNHGCDIPIDQLKSGQHKATELYMHSGNLWFTGDITVNITTKKTQFICQS